MDVLRKELNTIYNSQHLELETLDQSMADLWCERIKTVTGIERDCRVITDASADLSYVFGGQLAVLLGLTDNTGPYYKKVDSSDEDEIYNRMHPEDLVDKRMLEYEYFKFADRLPAGEKTRYKAMCRLRIKDRANRFVTIENSTRVLQESPDGKIWLILCCYGLSSSVTVQGSISPCIVDTLTGDVKELSLHDRRSQILTLREKEVLGMIRCGLPSKQIADRLCISIHTVNRHRQNILEKLSVGNSQEAIMAAMAMKLL